ncbi:WXG100 family type VII secretion target [Erysipelotrichaceae bacterium OH741_COT-311]|nr:pore-forming ESAT-6 family protein [Erysipelotrichaceae bacterium]MDO5085730.1 pore-forming ESAT-6 family protein [Erysipelotrichaceae bacterium]RRC93061.1 WXG100 family type VII secretion target [Erysipelotrichaceae bacterium OH741_COT-311]
MDEIKITMDEVNNLASTIRSINNNMYEALLKVKKEMQDLSLVWMSEGSETIRSRFSNFSNVFEEDKEIIESYAKFLEFTANTYSTIETTINSNASSF